MLTQASEALAVQDREWPAKFRTVTHWEETTVWPEDA